MSEIGLQSSHCQQMSFNALNVLCLRTRAQICIYLFLVDTSVSNSGKHPTEPAYCVARLNLISFCFYQFLLSGFTSFNHLLIATFSQCWLITAQQLLVNSIVGLLLVTNWILLCGHISIKNGDCKDKEHCMGESWNACPCTPTQTHTHTVSFHCSVCAGECLPWRVLGSLCCAAVEPLSCPCRSLVPSNDILSHLQCSRYCWQNSK